MQISTRGRYAIRIMIDLAINETSKPVLRKEISKRQGLSTEYTAQLFNQLCKGGVVKSIRGPGGGYTLGRSAGDISAGDIIRVVEGPIALVQCVLGTKRQACERVERCASHCLWFKLSQVMEEYLDSVSLLDLCRMEEDLLSSVLPLNNVNMG
jgi:Rrf2 family transcriptional regulator, cysteine metabolism repressor